ncbi:MAG: hypothetical protein ACRDI2_04165, partial [Chloroflexota bacterium]
MSASTRGDALPGQPTTTQQVIPGGPTAFHPRWRWLCMMWLLSWAIYAAYFQGQWVYGQRPIYHITGDEPHYLVIATSLLRDGDLDVLNNYRDKHYHPFYPYHLGDARSPEDMHAIYGRGGRLYSKHSLGLPLLLLPAMLAGGHGLAIVFQMAVAAVLSVQTYLLALDATGRRLPALVAWVAVAFTSPLLLYADQIYPEVSGALLTVIGLRAVLAAIAGSPTRRMALSIGLAVGLLPWLHLRYIPLAAVLTIAGSIALLGSHPIRAAGESAGHRSISLLPWLLAPPLAAGLALLAINWHLFGGVPPVDEYGAVSPLNVLTGAPGLLID